MRSAADGKSSTTRNPINGEQIEENTHQRMPLCPLFSAIFPTSPERKIQTKTIAIAITNELSMLHPPKRRACFFGAPTLLLSSASHGTLSNDPYHPGL